MSVLRLSAVGFEAAAGRTSFSYFAQVSVARFSSPALEMQGIRPSARTKRENNFIIFLREKRRPSGRRGIATSVACRASHGPHFSMFAKVLQGGSVCNSRAGPKGRKDLGIRGWQCTVCGAIHDRNVNAAHNILAAGHRRLAEGILVP